MNGSIIVASGASHIGSHRVSAFLILRQRGYGINSACIRYFNAPGTDCHRAKVLPIWRTTLSARQHDTEADQMKEYGHTGCVGLSAPSLH